MQTFYMKFISPTSHHRRKLSIQIHSQLPFPDMSSKDFLDSDQALWSTQERQGKWTHPNVLLVGLDPLETQRIDKDMEKEKGKEIGIGMDLEKNKTPVGVWKARCQMSASAVPVKAWKDYQMTDSLSL